MYSYERYEPGDRRLAAVEARIEASHLRHLRHPLEHRVDRREVVRLMERRQRHQRSQVLEHLRRDDHGCGIARPAVDDAMADGEHAGVAVLRPQPCGKRVERSAGVGDGAVQPLLGNLLALAVLRRESRRRANAVDLAARLELPLVFGGAVDAELEARRASVEDERVFAHNRS